MSGRSIASLDAVLAPLAEWHRRLRVVFEQATFNALAGWIPALLASILLYRVIGAVALLPLHMTARIIMASLGLTLGMCLISAAIAVGRVIRADPAEVF